MTFWPTNQRITLGRGVLRRLVTKAWPRGWHGRTTTSADPSRCARGSRRLLNQGLFRALIVASWIMRFVPLRVVYAVAALAGRCAYFLVPSARTSMVANLAVAVPSLTERQRARIAQQAFRNDALNWVDTLRIPELSDEELLATVKTDGWSHLESAVALGRGVICVTMHLGNYDLVGQLLQARGYQLTIPVERMQPPELFDFLVGRRASRGINIVPVDKAPREMIGALRRGELAGVAGDRDVTGHGVLVSFFGRDTLLPSGPATLARHSDAPVLIAIGAREHSGGYRGYIQPLSVQRTADAVADIRTNTQHIGEALERFIVRFPEQWLAFSPIWTDSRGPEDLATIRQQNEAAV